MARSLAVTAAAGIATSVVCLSLAGLFSPYRGLSFPFWSAPPYERGWWGYRRWRGQAPFIESGDIITREFGWDGGDSLQILIPGVVYFENAPEWSVSVKGRESSVGHLLIEDGTILLDAPPASPDTSLEVRIRGPSLESIGINGSGNLILVNIAQKEIAIDIRGSGSVEGSGKVEEMELRIFGSGSAELGELATGDLEVSIFGSGDAEVAPAGDVEVSIFGSGDLRLLTRPRRVSQRIMGSGRVIESAKGADESQITTLPGAVRSEQERISI